MIWLRSRTLYVRHLCSMGHLDRLENHLEHPRTTGRTDTSLGIGAGGAGLRAASKLLPQGSVGGSSPSGHGAHRHAEGRHRAARRKRG